MEISNSSSKSTITKRSSDQSDSLREHKKRLTDWEARRALFQSKLEEVDALPFGQTMRDRARTIRHRDIEILQERGITTFRQFLMQPVQRLLVKAGSDRDDDDNKIEKHRLQKIYNEVASSMGTSGTYQYYRTLSLGPNLFVGTTTTSSTVAFTDWMALMETQSREKPIGIHIQKCSGTPVAMLVCIGRLAFVLHLVLEGLSSDLLLPLLRIGRGGIGCDPETEQTLSHYLNLPSKLLSHSDEANISVTNSWVWVNEKRLGERQVESLLRIGHKGYLAAACAMWKKSPSPPAASNQAAKAKGVKCLVSPALLTLIGETYITKKKIVELVLTYIKDNNLQDQDTKKVTCNNDLQLVLKKVGPFTEKDIKRRLNPNLKPVQVIQEGE